jgi:hypothetical protein
MKTHDFAKQLALMAKILRAGPNVDLDELDASQMMHSVSTKAIVNKEDIPQALSMLVWKTASKFCHFYNKRAFNFSSS